MPQITHSWTPDEVRALPDDGRRWQPDAAVEPLRVDLPAFFTQVLEG